MKPKHNKGTVKDADKGALIQGSTTCASQTTRAKPFTGKVFYLDLTSNKVAETLEDNIKLLGGTVEKFFSKEIKYLVTNKREAKYVHCLRQDSPVPSPESGPSSPQLCSNPHQPQSLGDGSKSSAQLQKQMAAISRGKTLVKKVVKEQERIQMNKILSNALEWGVKILYLDDVISYVHKKKKGISCQQPAPSVVKTNMKNESTKCGFQKSKGRIGKPFIKVEDSSRHYRPFYLRLTNAPEFNLTSLPPCTPFCLEDKEVVANGTHCQRVAKASASDERPNERKKKKQGGFCECCLVKYENITTHLQSDRHKTFAKSDKYLVVDKLVSAMPCNFNRSKIKRPKCSVSSVLIAPGPCVETNSPCAALQTRSDGSRTPSMAPNRRDCCFLPFTRHQRMEKMLRPRWWISLLCVYGMMRVGLQSASEPPNGDALSRLKSLRNSDRFHEREDTVPVRLLYSRHNHTQIGQEALSTRVRDGSSSTQVNHVATATFQLDAFGRRFILDVELNHDLLSSDYVERHLSETGTAVVTNGGEHCYYQGKVRGISQSFVALSTCHGLHGLFFDGNHTYKIEPRDQDGKDT
uniref:Protein DBF4 homolog A n=1 Tax=Knipowitschia caucasica TaxID=637954 RepID=A0AAV2MCP2_KNICA